MFKTEPSAKSHSLEGEGLLRLLENEKQPSISLESEALLRQLVLHLPVLLIALGETGEIVFWNDEAERVLGYRSMEIVRSSRPWAEILFPSPIYRAHITKKWLREATDFRNEEWELIAKNGSSKTISWSSMAKHFLMPGWATWLVGIDVSERKKAEQERTALQAQVIQAQQMALRELSAPIIPIAEGVLAMPLVGKIDGDRAEHMLETLLDGVGDSHAKVIILDITGVPVVDSHVARILSQAAQMVKLLGVTVIITGIQPQVAQSMVSLGLDLRGTITLPTIQKGIAFALKGNPIPKRGLNRLTNAKLSAQEIEEDYTI